MVKSSVSDRDRTRLTVTPVELSLEGIITYACRVGVYLVFSHEKPVTGFEKLSVIVNLLLVTLYSFRIEVFKIKSE